MTHKFPQERRLDHKFDYKFIVLLWSVHSLICSLLVRSVSLVVLRQYLYSKPIDLCRSFGDTGLMLFVLSLISIKI